MDAAKVAPHDPLPAAGIGGSGELYAVENQARAAALGPEARRELRPIQSASVMALLQERLVAIRQAIAPLGALTKACDYALGQWRRLEEYLRDGRFERTVPLLLPRWSGFAKR